jgi:hypothetical protein
LFGFLDSQPSAMSGVTSRIWTVGESVMGFLR